ncbi:DUF4270 domain-containing protein [Algibacter sp. L4_22]|uniref:DUF4270 domain-containing protein n=1 Tax=Algibacter sp. L4_22 TaxID=2942477 RepID=UPI00201B6D1B|nr:DUF4270 domain-containing protein [Algibacter sp. L4_22]MCL5127401.1 DUF4270 domain-containing protein [Algibacter sp. L4_22]
MKKTFKALKFPAAFLFLLTSFVACDKEFTELDSAVLGKDNANFDTGLYEIPIVAYNKKLESVQVNNLASYLLGVFNDPAYGQTTASIVTQVTPSSYDPDFGDNPEITSVVLTIPYYSRINNYDEDGNAEYTIQDSLFGDYTGTVKPFKLSIYKNDYFLRDFDPFADADGDTTQKYYSYPDGSSDNVAYNGSSTINFDNLKGELIFEDESVEPSSDVIITVTDVGTDDELTTRSAPAFKVELDPEFWKNLIIEKEGESELSNANNFNNYFRGLFFKAEAVDDDGSMVMLDMSSTEANIVINYSYDSTIVDETIEGTYTLSFTGNTLNTFVNKITEVTLADGDETNGDEELYLKGSGNSMAVVDLFENDEAKKDFLDSFRIPSGDNYEKDEDGNYILNRLVNDAQLVIYEDEVMQAFPDDSNGNNYSHFNRIYAYDVNNSQSTIDYDFDPIESDTDPFNSKLISQGQRVGDENGNYKYKIRLTEHLNNILVNDSTNTKIGLVLSTNVNYITNAKIADSDDEDVTNVPAASVITPRGTVLYGSNESVDQEKKIKLKVFYTEPNK